MNDAHKLLIALSTIAVWQEIIPIFFASLTLLLTRFALMRLHQPTTPFVWLIKVLTSALSPILFLTGLFFSVLGVIVNSIPLTFLGGSSALLYLIHILKITNPPDSSTGFEKAFGQQWQSQIAWGKSFLDRRYMLMLPRPREPIFEPNISFYTIPASTRQLLCDIWRPPGDVVPSGLAFIYLHGSAWTFLDKDYGTRTFFKHLALQGHLIMDVAYRLYPECDFNGMVYDAKHAIAWMKSNATAYDVNPRKIVVGGGSAGAHLALLAAYTGNKHLVPDDLEKIDLSVHAVVSFYGQSDLSATYYHTCQHLVTRSALAEKKKGEEGGIPAWIKKVMGKEYHRLGFDKNVEPGMLVPILGRTPQEKPELYSRYSPITYANETCPVTLFIHGEQDILAPLQAIRLLSENLIAAGVPVVMHVIKQTDHAFDLILPRISPSAHSAIYDVERFLAVVSKRDIAESSIKVVA